MDKTLWQLRTTGSDDSVHVYAGFDAVLLAVPSPQAIALLETVPKSRRPSAAIQKKLAAVTVEPCWTLMLAFPQAVQPGLTTLGPQWNAARSTHHRIAWLARESSKPGRRTIERWTVQASAAWSQEHLADSKARVEGKLIKAFSEVTGIRAQPSHVESHRWLYAKTGQTLGQSHVWSAKTGLGLLHRSLHGVFIGHIHRRNQHRHIGHLCAQGFSLCLQRAMGAPTKGHAAAGLRQLQRDGRANACTRTGDEGVATLHFNPLWLRTAVHVRVQSPLRVEAFPKHKLWAMQRL
jgi:hypothetical protein